MFINKWIIKAVTDENKNRELQNKRNKVIFFFTRYAYAIILR